jgi:hypothetical protein
MKTTDIFKTNAKKLNESFEKTFGKKLKLETFTVPQLEDARNRLRTQIHQVRNGSNFNETVESEAYTKAQWMLDNINAELAERFEQEDVQSDESFETEESSGYYYERLAQEVFDMNPNLDTSGRADDLLNAAFPLIVRDLGSKKRANNLLNYDEDFPSDFVSAYGELKKTTGEQMTQFRESAADKAGAVVVAKDMTDKVSRWIEELSGMENDTLLSLGDTIRDEMGQEQAKAYLEAVAPAIQQALQNLKTTRETLATGMRGLTGEAQPAEIIGSEPEEGGDMDMAEPAAPDEMNMPAEEPAADEFAAAEPAAGAGAPGREQRESINRQNRLLKVLAG